MMKEKIEQTLALLNDAIETKKDKISVLAKQISEDALDARVDGPNFAKAALEKAQKLNMYYTELGDLETQRYTLQEILKG